jgi:hypothetical protein
MDKEKIICYTNFMNIKFNYASKINTWVSAIHSILPDIFNNFSI